MLPFLVQALEAFPGTPIVAAGGIAVRARKNQLLDTWLGKEAEMLDKFEQPVPQYVAARAAGQADLAPSLYGESAGFVDRVQTAEAFMQGICAAAEDHLVEAARRLIHAPES